MRTYSNNYFILRYKQLVIIYFYYSLHIILIFMYILVERYKRRECYQRAVRVGLHMKNYMDDKNALLRKNRIGHCFSIKVA